MQRHGAYATTSGSAHGAVPRRAMARSRAAAGPAEAGQGTGAVLDLREGRVARPELRFPAGDIVTVSGLPGSGKSTLIKRAVVGAAPWRGTVWCVDSQDTRERWEQRMPGPLPYGLYRPLVRIAHYAVLWRALRSGASLVVHDCGTQSWVRRWLAREARRRGRAMHLLLLDVPPEAALAGQVSRGRGVSGYAFARHRRAVRRLVAQAAAGRLPGGCVSAVLLDRAAASALRAIDFTGHCT